MQLIRDGPKRQWTRSSFLITLRWWLLQSTSTNLTTTKIIPQNIFSLLLQIKNKKHQRIEEGAHLHRHTPLFMRQSQSWHTNTGTHTSAVSLKTSDPPKTSVFPSSTLNYDSWSKQFHFSFQAFPWLLCRSNNNPTREHLSPPDGEHRLREATLNGIWTKCFSSSQTHTSLYEHLHWWFVYVGDLTSQMQHRCTEHADEDEDEVWALMLDDVTHLASSSHPEVKRTDQNQHLESEDTFQWRAHSKSRSSTSGQSGKEWRCSGLSSWWQSRC